MNLPVILNIETSGNACSVALSEGGTFLFGERSEGRSHASMLMPLIEQLLAKQRINISQLAAVAVSTGPGSYTGLRIGLSTAKGLCYGASIPLITVPTLQAMATGFIRKHPELDAPSLVCPMIDARRMEVFTAVYDMNARVVKEVAAEIVDEEFLSGQHLNVNIYFIGSGADKCRSLLARQNRFFPENTFSAEDLCHDAWEAFQAGRFADVAYAEPFYLKDFIAGKPKKMF